MFKYINKATGLIFETECECRGTGIEPVVEKAGSEEESDEKPKKAKRAKK